MASRMIPGGISLITIQSPSCHWIDCYLIELKPYQAWLRTWLRVGVLLQERAVRSDQSAQQHVRAGGPPGRHLQDGQLHQERDDQPQRLCGRCRRPCPGSRPAAAAAAARCVARIAVLVTDCLTLPCLTAALFWNAGKLSLPNVCTPNFKGMFG